MAEQTFQVTPCIAPDKIYKYRKNRVNPAQEIENGVVTYLTKEVKEVEGEGIFTYYHGIELPRVGISPTYQGFSTAMYEVNKVKRLIIGAIKILGSKDNLFPFIGVVFMGKKHRTKAISRILSALNEVGDMHLLPWYVDEAYLSSVSKQVLSFTFSFLKSLQIEEGAAYKTAEIIANIFEYDDAYRYRLQDLMSETSQEKMRKSFPKEVKRLLEISSCREVTDGPLQHNFRSFGRILRILYLIPSVKRAIIEAFGNVEWKEWQLTDNEIYHGLRWADYDLRGETWDERQKTYSAIYGNDERKMPQQIMINVK